MVKRFRKTARTAPDPPGIEVKVGVLFCPVELYVQDADMAKVGARKSRVAGFDIGGLVHLKWKVWEHGVMKSTRRMDTANKPVISQVYQ